MILLQTRLPQNIALEMKTDGRLDSKLIQLLRKMCKSSHKQKSQPNANSKHVSSKKRRNNDIYLFDYPVYVKTPPRIGYNLHEKRLPFLQPSKTDWKQRQVRLYLEKSLSYAATEPKVKLET